MAMELGGRLLHDKWKRSVYVSLRERDKGQFIKPGVNFTVAGVSVQELAEFIQEKVRKEGNKK